MSMAYSEYQPSSPDQPPSQEYSGGGGFGEQPYGGGGDQPPVEEGQPDDLGYVHPKVQLLRRIKGVILVVEVLVMVVLIYIAYTSKMAEFDTYSSKPIFPLEPVLFMMLLMGVFMAITGIIFRLAELRVTESGSQKVLLANSAFKSALTSMIVAIVFFILIFYLPGTAMVKDAITSKEDSTKEYGEETYKFKSQDEFLVTRATQVAVSTTNNVPVDFMIVSKDKYDNLTTQYKLMANGNMTPQRFMNYTIENKIDYKPNSTSITKAGSSMPFGEYRVFTSVGPDASAKIHYEVQREVQPNLLNTLTMFLLVFAIMDGAWMVVALGIKQKYKKQSIYK
jgi:uncharacterized integral membrane protein